MDVITTTHKTTFNANLMLALQQRRSILETAFTFQSDLKGRIAQFLELMGATSAVKNLGRKADTPDIDANVEPIWIQPTQLAWGRMMEVEDTIKAVMNHQSTFIVNGAAAMVRGKDEVLRDAIFGNRRIGQDGGTTSAWNGDTVAVGVGHADGVTATGMNVQKLLRARRYLRARQVDTGFEQLFLAFNAQGEEEMFKDLTFINGDYRNHKPLDAPEHVSILGVTFLPGLEGTVALPDYDASTSTAVLFAKSAMHYGDFDPLRTDIPLRPDKLNRPHPHMEQWLGSSRSEDYKVVKILNKK